jgi:hypothetical protein
MNDRSCNFFRRLSIVLALLLLAEGAGGALAVVGLREQQAKHAESANQIERAVGEASQKLRSLDAMAEQDQQPDFLRSRIGDRMVAPLPKQIVWVRPAPPSQNRPEVAPVPTISFQVASIDPDRAPAPLR